MQRRDSEYTVQRMLKMQLPVQEGRRRSSEGEVSAVFSQHLG